MAKPSRTEGHDAGRGAGVRAVQVLVAPFQAHRSFRSPPSCPPKMSVVPRRRSNTIPAWSRGDGQSAGNGAGVTFTHEATAECHSHASPARPGAEGAVPFP